MLKRLILYVLAFIMITIPCLAREVGGIHIPDTLELDGSRLTLNGSGIREKFFIDIYVGALYLRHKNSHPKKIISADEPMAIRLHIVSGLIKGKQMKEATLEGFEKSTKGNVGPIQPQIDKFISVFKDAIHPNDVYDLVYIPGNGIKAYKNGTFVLSAKGFDFKQALFGIWLCDTPVQESLKKEMPTMSVMISNCTEPTLLFLGKNTSNPTLCVFLSILLLIFISFGVFEREVSLPLMVYITTYTAP